MFEVNNFRIPVEACIKRRDICLYIDHKQKHFNRDASIPLHPYAWNFMDQHGVHTQPRVAHVRLHFYRNIFNREYTCARRWARAQCPYRVAHLSALTYSCGIGFDNCTAVRPGQWYLCLHFFPIIIIIIIAKIMIII